MQNWKSNCVSAIKMRLGSRISLKKPAINLMIIIYGKIQYMCEVRNMKEIKKLSAGSNILTIVPVIV